MASEQAGEADGEAAAGGEAERGEDFAGAVEGGGDTVDPRVGAGEGGARLVERRMGACERLAKIPGGAHQASSPAMSGMAPARGPSNQSRNSGAPGLAARSMLRWRDWLRCAVSTAAVALACDRIAAFA